MSIAQGDSKEVNSTSKPGKITMSSSSSARTPTKENPYKIGLEKSTQKDDGPLPLALPKHLTKTAHMTIPPSNWASEAQPESSMTPPSLVYSTFRDKNFLSWKIIALSHLLHSVLLSNWRKFRNFSLKPWSSIGKCVQLLLNRQQKPQERTLNSLFCGIGTRPNIAIRMRGWLKVNSSLHYRTHRKKAIGHQRYPRVFGRQQSSYHYSIFKSGEVGSSHYSSTLDLFWNITELDCFQSAIRERLCPETPCHYATVSCFGKSIQLEPIWG